MKDFEQYIGIDPKIRFGKPCIKNTRITVGDILNWLSSGMTFKEILKDFPVLKIEEITAAIEFPADRESKVIENWVRASRELNFQITTPYLLKFGENEMQVSAFLPEYGKPRGMIFDVIDPSETTDERIWTLARENDIYCSFISSSAYLDYDINLIVETLKDWGYFGLKKIK